MSNGKPVKEIIPGLIRKLLIQRKDYLKQQRINRSKKNRDPNQPKLPGMKQGGVMAKKSKFLERRKKLGGAGSLGAALKAALLGARLGRKTAGKKAHGGKVTKRTTMQEFSKGKRLSPGIRLKGGKSFIKEYKRRLQHKAEGGFVKAAGGTKRVPGSGAATKGTNFEGIF